MIAGDAEDDEVERIRLGRVDSVQQRLGGGELRRRVSAGVNVICRASCRMLSILNSAIWAWIISCYGKSVKIVPERGGEKSQNDRAPIGNGQVPMTNQIPMTNDQLGFGIWSLIGHWGLVIWALVIGAWSLTSPIRSRTSFSVSTG